MSTAFTEFAKELHSWYWKYPQSDYFKGSLHIEGRLGSKARDRGHLELDDLVEIANWGGRQHGIHKRVQRENTCAEVRTRTAKAVDRLDDPAAALESLLEIREWGLTYASKTLRFMCPSNYGALDSVIREAIDPKLLPRIYDGHTSSMVNGYERFLALCIQLRTQIKERGPREGGVWFVADIEMALFQFVSEGGMLRR